MQKIKLSGKEYGLYYSTKAMLDIEKRCGDIAEIKEWLSSGTKGETFRKLAEVITDLINGEVFRHNSDIALGLCDGEKLPYMDEENVINIMSPADIRKYENAVFSSIVEGMKVDFPEGIDEPDPDLADVESEKNA